MFVAAPDLTGQNFVYHVYVDPIYGDDNLAYADVNYTPPAPNTGNPTGNTNPPTVFSQHPSGPQGFQQYNAGPIQHAPYSFKTLTGGRGALAYLLQFLPLPKTFNGATMTHIVVHCLPGMYGPSGAIDARSGLKFNGESFPITLNENYNGVSLQGTSALNTIFDARGDVTNVIQLSSTITEVWFAQSIIDSITIRGARSSPTSAVGAGIAISGETSIRITISNCFITDNQVGIAIWADRNNDVDRQLQTPIIVNNTIAFNQVGIWSGAYMETNPQYQRGHGKPRILNNVIDSKNVFFPVGTVTSCFEGVHANDTIVRQVGTALLGYEMNAWELGMAQLGVVPPGYPPTAPRSPPPQPPGPAPLTPRVDILPYTHAGTGTPHGTLFVSDVLRNYNLATGVFTPDSEHDFRLAPLAGTSAMTAPSVLNPLVNMGLDHSLGAIQMVNGHQPSENNMGLATPTIGGPPGPSPAIPPNKPMHAWDWDAEGFGNPRIVQRPGSFPVPNWPPGPVLSLLDLGADECGGLIMGGYIFGTTVFARLVPQAPGIIDHTGVYFFDIAGATRPRPLCTIWIGQHYAWWTHVQSNPWSAMHNYTAGVPMSQRNNWSANNGLFLRNLECDVSPHLAIDVHPYWALWVFGNDGFAANPWYRSPNQWQNDNHSLYYAPLAARPGQVLDSTLNPPGSWVFLAGFGYLFPGQTTYQFGPYNGGGATYGINSWGFGDAIGQDIIPDTQGYGLRFTCQSNPSAATALDNIQSFLGINTSALTEGTQNAARRAAYRASTLQVKANTVPDLDKIQREAARR